MTFSLITVDRNHDFMVVATATKTPAVGESVPAILPGVGGVVSQSFTNPQLRELCLSALAGGHTPTEAITFALESDGEPELRQLGLMSAAGKAAAHTGNGCTPATGELVLENFLGVGNLLANNRVIPAMARAWEGASGLEDLARSALRCMVAAEAAGGDSRGKQSAAMLISSMGADAELLAELRVDDSLEPLDELEELLTSFLAKAPSV